MAYIRLALTPGIDKQNTEYGAEGGWTDCDHVRFRYGLPEKLGGWTPFDQNETYLIGLASDTFTWNALDGVAHMIIGTTRKLYVFASGTWADITPIRATSDPGDATFAAVNGSTTLTVTQVDHGAITGDFVTFSAAVSLGGVITAPVLNQEYEITLVVDDDTYEITAPIAANASDAGNGGGATVATYQINVGTDINYFDFGWGIGTWGASTWGTPRPASLANQINSRIWQLDAFGEDVVCQLVDGPAYLYDTSAGLATRATIIAGAPTKSKYALISTPDRHFVCFGTESTIGVPSTQDPMFVRFSDQENLNDFVETATNTAGGQRLTDGSRIVSAIRSRGQILIFTDTSLHGMQFVGPPFVFGFQQLGANCGCIGAHAAVDVNGIAFWMGPEAFYMFDGTVKKMACTVQDFVFKDLNLVQGTKFHAGVNSQFNEVTWWYSSFTSDYNDRFVTYNYLENVWSIGSMPRSAWTDIGTYRRPIATEYLVDSTEPSLTTIQGLTAGRSIAYNQEDGFDANGQPIDAYIVSGYFDLGDGDNMLFMKRFIPDFKNQVGNLTVRCLLRPYPQASASPSSLDPYVITPTTQKVDTRARGRQIQLRIESVDLNTNWRFGTLRIDAQPDGLR
jgi:hypothetical protein